MKILSLFDGISCARVALERAGFEIEKYYASEIDKYAIQIAQKNYPDTIQVGSVVGLDGTQFKDIDLLIGGSPCQDLSIAKKDRKGLLGKRSGLFYEYVRILHEVKPKYFILENVASMPKEAKQQITEIMGVEPIMINAALVSAQNRKRLFWTNIPNVTQPEDRGILLKDILEDNIDKKYFLNVDRTKYVLNRPKNFAVKIDPEKTNTIRTNYGNASANETYVSTIRVGSLNSGGQGDRIYSPQGKSVNLSANGGGGGAKTGLYAVSQRGRNIVNGKRKDILGAKTKQRIEVGQSDKAHTITRVQKDSMVMNDTQIRKLTPIECERLQGLEDNYTEGVSNTQRYKILGNAFNVDVVAHILNQINYE